MSCFKCNTTDPCNPTAICNCAVEVCNSCEVSIGAECIVANSDLFCSNGAFIIKSGTKMHEVINQLICKINVLETRINTITTNCCPQLVCDIPAITGFI